MFDMILQLCMFLLSLSIVITLYRIIRGESIPDRVLALDTISYSVIGILTILSIKVEAQAYSEAILLIAILAFLSTVALSRFVERGVVIEHKRDD